jgi:hypothetical protein
MERVKRISIKRILIAGSILVMLAAGTAFLVVARTWGRTVIQVDIHQDKKIIHLSNFAEPPQFAIWLENPANGELKTVFVTHRVAAGDWEGKANVPVALPLWFDKFKGPGAKKNLPAASKNNDMAITGATPKNDYFSVRIEAEPGSEWICWIEMNLAGDFNDAYPEVDLKTLREDEFSNGQPALIYKCNIRVTEGMKFRPELVAQSVWTKGVVTVEPVSDGITSAKKVFDDISISVNRPKPKLIDKTRIQNL